ncbi:MAG: GNAT family N-acetyltransferase [Reyranella sp.]|nr:GNAT family N-acetyltransferase [Reyranella sp.]
MDPSGDYEIIHLTRSVLSSETERAVQALLKQAFGDIDGDYYAGDNPERIMLLSSGGRLVGHFAAYVREVALGGEELAIGLIGGVAIDVRFRSQGLSKRLLREAHAFFGERALPFSVLFACEPARYRSSGYRPMTNETRFIEGGQWKQFVYRGGMVAELGERKWPDTLLDLRGRAV